MAEESAIEWTNATGNFWWGCTKVGPGCDHCYAETWSKRSGENLWGLNAPRRLIKGTPAMLRKLNAGAAHWQETTLQMIEDAKFFGKPDPFPKRGYRRRVFIQSMSDLFDLEVPQEWFNAAWSVMCECVNLDIQIVTKRVSAVEKRLKALPPPTLIDPREAINPSHIGLIITVCNQDEANRDIRRLVDLKRVLNIPWIGLSVEPMLGFVRIESDLLREIDWVICGGESGKDARPMLSAWPRDLRDQCEKADVAFLFKQRGEWSPDMPDWSPAKTFHDGELLFKVGKKAAGRVLDGRLHDGYPKALQKYFIGA